MDCVALHCVYGPGAVGEPCMLRWFAHGAHLWALVVPPHSAFEMAKRNQISLPSHFFHWSWHLRKKAAQCRLVRLAQNKYTQMRHCKPGCLVHGRQKQGMMSSTQAVCLVCKFPTAACCDTLQASDYWPRARGPLETHFAWGQVIKVGPREVPPWPTTLAHACE